MPEEMTEMKSEILFEVVKLDFTGISTDQNDVCGKLLVDAKSIDNLVNFIISRERRIVEEIVEPLKEFKTDNCKSGIGVMCAIDEALSKAEEILR